MRCLHGMEEGQCAPCQRLLDLAARQAERRNAEAARTQARAEREQRARPKFDAAGERTHDEACWGYVGDDARTVLEQDVENVMRDAAKLQGEANVETVVEEFVVGASIEVLESLATI